MILPYRICPDAFYDHVNGLRVGVSVETHHQVRQAPRAYQQPPSATEESSQPPRQARRRRQGRQRRATVDAQPVSTAHNVSPANADALLPLLFVPANHAQAAPTPAPRGTRGLTAPLDPITDIGGQFGRRGLGHRDVPPSIATNQASSLLPITSTPQPQQPEAMDLLPALPDCSLLEACMLWLEDRTHGISRDAVREAICTFFAEHPSAFQEYQHSHAVPAGAFRNELRNVIRRLHTNGAVDSDEDEEPIAVLEHSMPSTASLDLSSPSQPAHQTGVYQPPHRRRTNAPTCGAGHTPPTRQLPPRKGRGQTAAIPYWASTAQPAAPRGHQK